MIGLTALATALSGPALAQDESPHHVEIGVTLGTPGAFNFMAGYFNQRIGGRLTVGGTPDTGLGSLIGIQGMVGYEFDPASRHNHVVGVTAGYMAGAFDYIYGGAAYSVRLQRGFYFESGWAYGVGSGNAFQLTIQIGYLGRVSFGE